MGKALQCVCVCIFSAEVKSSLPSPQWTSRGNVACIPETVVMSAIHVFNLNKCWFFLLVFFFGGGAKMVSCEFTVNKSLLSRYLSPNEVTRWRVEPMAR